MIATKITQIVSLLLVYTSLIPSTSPPGLDHFMSLHLSRSVSSSSPTLFISFAAFIGVTAINTRSTHQLCSSSSVIAVTAATMCIFVSIFSPASATTSGLKWSPRHVDTKLGVVQGYVIYPNGFDGVEVLLNMPYASPPLGSLRFMPPTTPQPWSGVRRSEKPGPVCPQVLPDIRNETEALKSMPRGRLVLLQRLLRHLKDQSEDCLHLNLYVPIKVAEGRIQEKLPVLVFIHGDDYGFGSGSAYDPSMLSSFGNIIIVTLNYRLGILGFLNANSDSHFRLPYNFALLDQIAALQWIQENVALFGGDRFNVTLMGHSKGAILVNFLMISSAVPTGLLFHRVILSSGSALSPLASDLSNGPELSKRFAKRVRCPPEPSSTMLECLREVPVRQFLESELWSLFGPTGDGIVVKNEMPSDNVIMNKASHYPLLFGVVKQESLPGLSNHDITYGMENERRRELLRQFINKHYRFHRNEILAGAIHEYTDWERPVQHPQNVREETLDALADAQVIAPMTKVGDLHSQSSKSRAYFYVFEYQSKSSDYQQRLGCVHGEDLLYLFGVPLFFYDYDSATIPAVDSATPEMMRSDISGTGGGGDYASAQMAAAGSHQELHLPGSQQPQPKEKMFKVKDELGFFTGNFTWYEVQLSLTVMRLWANFVRVGNPNEDPKPFSKGGKDLRFQQWPLEKVETGSQTNHYRSFGGGGSNSPGGHASIVSDILDGGEEDGGSELSESNSSLDRLGRGKMIRGQRQNNQQQQQQQLPDPILVDWPQYESLDKKYLLLDLRPRLKSHYRAHKLSFWLHLVPDYQKNDDLGTSVPSVHHGIIFSNGSSTTNNNKVSPHQTTNKNNNEHHPLHSQSSLENLSKDSVIPSHSPTVFASGLYDLSQGMGSQTSSGSSSAVRPHNSSLPNLNSPKLSPQSPEGGGGATDPKEQQDAGENHISHSDEEESTFPFSTYSTALSVTVAIGVSLFILNILIFATFYYEREKRLNAFRAISANTNSGRPRGGGGSTSNMSPHHLQEQNSQKNGSSHPSEHPLVTPRHQHHQQQRIKDQSLNLTNASTSTSPRLQNQQQHQHQICSRPGTSSTFRSLKRRSRENGGMLGGFGMDDVLSTTQNCATSNPTYSSYYVDDCSTMDPGKGHFLQSTIERGESSCIGLGGSSVCGTSGAFGDLHLSAYETTVEDDDDAESLRCGESLVTSGEMVVNYGNYPIERYSESGLSGSGSGTMGRNRSRRAINELGMSAGIDMSESVANANFSPQSSPHNVEIGTATCTSTFVGIEEEEEDGDCYQRNQPPPQSTNCHFRHPPQLQHLHRFGLGGGGGDNSNSSFEDGQSST